MSGVDTSRRVDGWEESIRPGYILVRATDASRAGQRDELSDESKREMRLKVTCVMR